MALVTIRNSQTGEVKQVDDSQLSSYGINQPSSNKKSVEDIRRSNTLPQTIGGIGGGILGSLVAGMPGGIVGATGGGALGSALNDLIAQIFGKIKNEPVSTPNPLDYTKAGATQGAYQTAGEALAGVGGLVAHPIKSVVNNLVVKPLANSPAVVDIGQVLGDLYSAGKSLFAKKLMATAFPEAYNTIASNVAASVADIVPHQAAEVSSFVPKTEFANIPSVTDQTVRTLIRDLRTTKNPAFKEIIPQAASKTFQVPINQTIPDLNIGDIASQIIPVSEANLLKSSAQRGVAEFYGQEGPAVVELQKLLANLLRNKIESSAGVPASVGIGNRLASLMYSVPDTLTGLTYGLPWAAGRSVRAAAGIPIHLAQFLLSNPLTQYGLPAMSQLIGGALNQNQ